jgi:hypothetical protein
LTYLESVVLHSDPLISVGKEGLVDWLDLVEEVYEVVQDVVVGVWKDFDEGVDVEMEFYIPD